MRMQETSLDGFADGARERVWNCSSRHRRNGAKTMSQTVLSPNRQQTPVALQTAYAHAVSALSAWLNTHSITILRVSLGLVFLGFGVLKFVPGLSPAEDLAVATVDRLTLGIVSGQAALLLTATMETVIGLTLVTGRFVRVGLVVLAGALVGIMSPLVLFPGDLFGGGPTIVAQYVVKDVVLIAGGLVVAAHTLGGRIRSGSST
jgi:putative oxidoreductase